MGLRMLVPLSDIGCSPNVFATTADFRMPHAGLTCERIYRDKID
jgi:hypothetical protein